MHNKITRLALVPLLLQLPYASGKNQEAPPFEKWAPQFNTPGSMIRAKEMGRKKTEGVTVVTYQFVASGLPAEKPYRFWLWELGRDPQFGIEVILDVDGTVMTKTDAANSVPREPLEVHFFGVPAEPKRFALVSKDGQQKAFGQVIPFPIESVDGSCRLSVEMQSPLYTVVTLYAEGLKPRENFEVRLQSGREGGRLKPTADEQGRWNSVIAPYVKGKKEGFTQVELSSKECKLKTTFPWGAHYFQ